jgi:hypothetical protein
MDRRRRHSPYLAALFALFLGVFALSPVVDAMACAGEVEPVSAAAVVQDDDGHGPASDIAHGACTHGHCHHGAKAPSERLDDRVAAATRVSHARAPDDRRAVQTPDGLMRPPRG